MFTFGFAEQEDLLKGSVLATMRHEAVKQENVGNKVVICKEQFGFSCMLKSF